MFFAALELYLKLIGRDDEPEYDFDDLFYELKSEVYGLSPMLEFDANDAFARVKEFAAAGTEKNNPELKRFEDIRYAIVVTSVVRTLQQTRYGRNAPPMFWSHETAGVPRFASPPQMSFENQSSVHGSPPHM